jgi:hypothetical protein
MHMVDILYRYCFWLEPTAAYNDGYHGGAAVAELRVQRCIRLAKFDFCKRGRQTMLVNAGD